jgi:hypothetical protein
LQIFRNSILFPFALTIIGTHSVPRAFYAQLTGVRSVGVLSGGSVLYLGIQYQRHEAALHAFVLHLVPLDMAHPPALAIAIPQWMSPVFWNDYAVQYMPPVVLEQLGLGLLATLVLISAVRSIKNLLQTPPVRS